MRASIAGAGASDTFPHVVLDVLSDDWKDILVFGQNPPQKGASSKQDLRGWLQDFGGRSECTRRKVGRKPVVRAKSFGDSE